MERNQKTKRLSAIMFLFVAALFVSFFLYLGNNENINIFSPRYSPYYGKIINLTPETVTDDTAPMGTRTVYSWLMDAHCDIGDYLCFYVSNNHVDITVDGELIYSLHSSDEDPVGRSVSSNWCTSVDDLMRYPLDIVKIDRSMLLNACTEKGKTEFCELVIKATQMGLKVVCEGIETEEQNRFAREAGCHYGQGFLFFKPVSQDRVFEMMHKGSIIEDDL